MSTNLKGDFQICISVPLLSLILIISNLFSLLTFLGEIIELWLQEVNFFENVMPTLNKETKNKVGMLKIDVS